MIVVDASALIEVILRTQAGSVIERRMFAPGETRHAPHLIDIETTQVVRRYVAKGDLEIKRGREAIRDLAAVSLIRYAHWDLLPRVWAMRDNISAYDAVYIALAEQLDAPLITRDRRLASAPGHQARVELI